jgi:hypothetical protein
MFKKYTAGLLMAVLSMIAMVSPAHAALDAAITTAITAAQTDLLALLTALTVAGAAIWVGRVIYAHFRVK